MKIQFMSDLHLGFRDNLQYVNGLDIPVTGDILILAGDTGYLRDTNMPKLKFWKWASKNYREVLLIPEITNSTIMAMSLRMGTVGIT